MGEDAARQAWDDVAALQGRGNEARLELGPSAAFQYHNDPRHLVFVLSRYKFCAKLLEGREQVLEVGCGDGVGMPIVAQAVGRVVGVDWEQELIEGNRRRLAWLDNCEFRQHDFAAAPVEGAFDAVYALDVIEHVPADQEDRFMRHCAQALPRNGACLIGTPNKTSEAYASEASRIGHVNLKDAASLRALLEAHFESVFLFSMNDEVVHTGFYPMAHYLWALGVGRRDG